MINSEGTVAEENYWYSQLVAEVQLEAEAVAEAKIIVDAFRAREIEIGGFPDCAEEDDDLHPGGIAFMYAQGQILTRERYLSGAGWTPEPPDRLSVSRPRGILEILGEDHRVREIEITRVVRDIVRLRLNPRRGRRLRHREQPDVLKLLKRLDAELGPGIAAPDHVLTAAQHMTPCSATEPQQVYPTSGPYPAVCRDGGAPASRAIPTRESRTARSCPTGDTGRSSRASCGAWPRERKSTSRTSSPPRAARWSRRS